MTGRAPSRAPRDDSPCRPPLDPLGHHAEPGTIVSEVARGVIDLGLAPGDRVALLCSTRPEWSLCDFAISAAGGVVVPIYPTNSPRECAWAAGKLRVADDRLRGRRPGGEDRRGARRSGSARAADR